MSISPIRGIDGFPPTLPYEETPSVWGVTDEMIMRTNGSEIRGSDNLLLFLSNDAQPRKYQKTESDTDIDWEEWVMVSYDPPKPSDNSEPAPTNQRVVQTLKNVHAFICGKCGQKRRPYRFLPVSIPEKEKACRKCWLKDHPSKRRMITRICGICKKEKTFNRWYNIAGDETAKQCSKCWCKTHPHIEKTCYVCKERMISRNWKFNPFTGDFDVCKICDG